MPSLPQIAKRLKMKWKDIPPARSNRSRPSAVQTLSVRFDPGFRIAKWGKCLSPPETLARYRNSVNENQRFVPCCHPYSMHFAVGLYLATTPSNRKNLAFDIASKIRRSNITWRSGKKSQNRHSAQFSTFYRFIITLKSKAFFSIEMGYVDEIYAICKSC